MQWFLLAVWCGVMILGTNRKSRWLRPVIAMGLICAMGTQLWLLHLDGMFTWEAALPLHLCSLFGVLSIPMLWRTPQILFEACCFLGAPGALLTLFFPAVVRCTHPVLMQLAFYQLHVLVALMPLYWYKIGKPLPIDPRRTLVMGSGYLVFVSWFNRVFQTNYLFLRAAPVGTPLDWLFRQGTLFYLCALELLCMLVFSWLKPLYLHLRK